jgi:hypothetical protein
MCDSDNETVFGGAIQQHDYIDHSYVTKEGETISFRKAGGGRVILCIKFLREDGAQCMKYVSCTEADSGIKQYKTKKVFDDLMKYYYYCSGPSMHYDEDTSSCIIQVPSNRYYDKIVVQYMDRVYKIVLLKNDTIVKNDYFTESFRRRIHLIPEIGKIMFISNEMIDDIVTL